MTEELEAAQVRTRTAVGFFCDSQLRQGELPVISDGRSRLQVYVTGRASSERDFKIFKPLDFWRLDWRRGAAVPHSRMNELTIWTSKPGALAKASLPLPEKGNGLAEWRSARQR